jgi:hypothetical protein
VEQVDGLSKSEHRTCLTQAIEVEGTFHDDLKHVEAKPALLNM